MSTFHLYIRCQLHKTINTTVIIAVIVTFIIKYVAINSSLMLIWKHYIDNKSQYQNITYFIVIIFFISHVKETANLKPEKIY